MDEAVGPGYGLTMADAVRIHVRVTGRVQGVFFRATARDLAGRLGLTGWIENRPDGDVEAEFQGDPQAVDEAVAFCRQGPAHGYVSRVAVRSRDVVDREQGFRVR